MPAGVSDNTSLNRFEMLVDGHIAFVTYKREAGQITLLHAEVPAALAGAGVGSKLVQQTLLAVRPEGRKVIPRCSFVAAYIKRHPEFADLVG